MFLEVCKNMCTGEYISHRLVTRKEMVKKHPHSLELHGWASSGRLNTRFGFSNSKGRFLYVRTDEKDKEKLANLAKSFK